jgi:hypothetical protein
VSEDRSSEQTLNRRQSPPALTNGPKQKIENMKMLSKLALAAAILASTCAAKAEWVSGYVRSSGTYVQPYYRTPANGVPYDNLSYRGYPSQQPGYISPRANSFGADWTGPKTMPYYGDSKSDTGLLPYTGNDSPKPLYGNSRSSGAGF